MGLNKLLHKLGKLLERNTQGKKLDCDEVKELILKLEKKRQKLEDKIADEKNTAKRKSFKLDLKITVAELKKGNKLLKKRCY